jgi:hypothetical protein
MDQTLQGLNQAGPAFISYLLIGVALLSGYCFMAFKKHWLPKLNPAPRKDTSGMTLWQRIKSFGASSQRELTEAEWASIRRCRRVFLPVTLVYTIFLGFFASSFGMVFMLWFWLATVGGMMIRYRSDRHLEKLGEAGQK